MPCIVQEIGRESPAMFLEMPAGWFDRSIGELHMCFFRRPATFPEIAGQARSGDIFPGCAAFLAARDDMVKGQIVG